MAVSYRRGHTNTTTFLILENRVMHDLVNCLLKNQIMS